MGGTMSEDAADGVGAGGEVAGGGRGLKESDEAVFAWGKLEVACLNQEEVHVPLPVVHLKKWGGREGGRVCIRKGRGVGTENR